MTGPKLLKHIVIAAAMTAMTGAALHAEEPRGARPSSVTKPLSEVPNSAAFTARIWAPQIDDGYVPQGLSFADGHLLLSTYRSTDPKQGRGPCRLFVIAPDTGAVSDHIDLPESCGHAGGIAVLADGRIVVADTHAIYEIKDRKVTATVQLKGKLRGSFADADGNALWIGSYDKGGGALWQLPSDVFSRSDIDESSATKTLTIPARVQGLLFDGKGNGWMTISGSHDGALLKFDPADGHVIATYPMPAGIEDLAMDSTGMIWAVSEAGSLRWSNWATTYPVLFAIDPAKLR
jgi:outer membrane protein assembly factor BamB